MKRTWRCLGTLMENEPIYYKGINLRDHPGVSLGETIELPHPQYPLQLHSMSVYRSESDGQTVIYAIDELSAAGVTASMSRSRKRWRGP